MVKKIKQRNFIKLDMDLHCKPQTFLSKKNQLLEKVLDEEMKDYFNEKNK
jgi:hypothetical protein